jgi:hypothetical protein
MPAVAALVLEAIAGIAGKTGIASKLQRIDGAQAAASEESRIEL